MTQKSYYIAVFYMKKGDFVGQYFFRRVQYLHMDMDIAIFEIFIHRWIELKGHPE